MPDDQKKTVEFLLEEQKKLLDIVIEQNHKIQRRLTLMAVGGYVRIALVIVPLIIAAFFLPPLLRQMFDQLGPSFGGGLGAGAKGGGLPLDPKQLQELLKSFQQ